MLLENIDEIVGELTSQLKSNHIPVRKYYDNDINAHMLKLGRFGTIRITASAVKNKWNKYRFELSRNYNNKVKLKIEKGITYYQVPLENYQWIIDFIEKEKNKHTFIHSSVQDMAQHMQDELDKENLLTSVENKEDGIYLNGVYETIRISNTPPKPRRGFQYDLRQDRLKKSIHKNKAKCYTVSFNHYKWILENMKKVHHAKDKLSVQKVADNLKQLLLQEDISVVEHKSSSTNSVYLHLDSNMLGAIRVSDHKTHDKQNKYDICSKYRFKGKGKRTDNYSFVYNIPIEKWKTVIHLVKEDRNHKLKKYGELAYNFKVETSQL